MIHLNKEQVKVASTTEGNLLIVASAGTGKTMTIVERYVNFVTKPEKVGNLRLNQPARD